MRDSDRKRVEEATKKLVDRSSRLMARYYIDVAIAERVFEQDPDKGNALFEEALDRFFNSVEPFHQEYDKEMLRIDAWRSEIKSQKRSVK